MPSWGKVLNGQTRKGEKDKRSRLVGEHKRRKSLNTESNA